MARRAYTTFELIVITVTLIASFYKLFIGKFQSIDLDSTFDEERERLHLEWVERERVAQEEHLQRILHPASFVRFSRKQMRVATPRISFPQPNLKSFTTASTPVCQCFRRLSRKP